MNKLRENKIEFLELGQIAESRGLNNYLNFLWIGVVEVVVVDCWVVGVLTDVTLIVVVDIDDVIPPEPLLCLLMIDGDVFSVLAQNSCFVCTVCHSGLALLFLFFFLQMWLSQLQKYSSPQKA